jgi:alanine-glyoxylate transaminase / serine-glyoxylate transaminase / serine-pyruvate transaminase
MSRRDERGMIVEPGMARARGEWPIAPGRTLNMSTGPVEVSRHVLDAQLADLLTPHSEAFWALHDETCALLGRILRTRQRVLMMHGSIRTGIDLALGNWIKPGTRVLSIQNGFWGELIATWAERYGAVVERLVHGALEPIDVDRVAAAMQRSRFDLVALVHVETNSGLVNPVEQIGRLVAETDALYFVDTACSAGAMRVETDAWGIDVQTTGSHKCLAAIPGLAIVTASEKAWDRLRAHPAVGNYFDFRTWWTNAIERPVVPPFTQPTTLVLALRAALLEIDTVSIERWWTIHREVADRFVQELRAIGFGLLIEKSAVGGQRAFYSDTVMAVRYPDRIVDASFRKLLLERYGIFVIGNIGEFAGKSFRVGLMSPPQMQPVNLFGTLAALREVVASTNAFE